LKDLDVDGRILLKLVFRKWDEEAWTRFIWLKTGTGALECGRKYSGFLKCGNSLTR
jgi:hypothetical protein